MTLTVREMLGSEVDLIIEYFRRKSTPEHLEILGVDPTRMPPVDGWRDRLRRECALPADNHRTLLLVIWLSDERPIGFSTSDKIRYGEQAHMHLHVTAPERRHQGIGAEFISRSVDIYFERLKLKRLFCEPNAFNAAPNRGLPEGRVQIPQDAYDRTRAAQLSSGRYPLDDRAVRSRRTPTKISGERRHDRGRYRAGRTRRTGDRRLHQPPGTAQCRRWRNGAKTVRRFRAFDADPGARLRCSPAPAAPSAPAPTSRRSQRRSQQEARDRRPRPIAPMGPSRLRLSKPVIAAVEGHAVAGGMELALWATCASSEDASVSSAAASACR